MKAHKPLTPSKHIIFICNWERTDSINAVAQMIKESRPEISIWALIHDDMAKSLLDNTIYDSVLDIRNAGVIAGENLLSIDAMREVLSRDRFLDDTPANHVFLQRQYHLMSDWLAPVENAVFVGEVSWASEELALIYARSRVWDYYTPSVSRCFDRRWFLAHGMSEEMMVSPVSEVLPDSKSHTILSTRPQYYHQALYDLKFVNRLRSTSLKKLISYLKSRKRRGLFISKVKKQLSWVLTALMENNLKSSKLVNKKIAIFPMHVQPEASVDYLAPKLRDQYKVVNKLAKILPEGYVLAVKDHPANIHEFSIMSKIKLIFSKKIFYLKPDFDIAEHYSEINMGFAITGTLALQLAERGVPTFTLARMFFNEHALCNFLDLDAWIADHMRADNVLGLNLEEENKRVKAHVFNNSFEGFCFSTEEHGFRDPLYVTNLAHELTSRAIHR